MNERCFGIPSFFYIVDESRAAELEATLSVRNLRLLVGAANFHALENQGAELDLDVFLGPKGTPPSLTDVGTRERRRVAGARHVGSMRIRSSASGSRSAPPVTDGVPLPESGRRSILLSEDAGDGGFTMRTRIGLQWRIRQAVEHALPTQYDFLRQLLVNHRRAKLDAHVIPRVDSIPGKEPRAVAAPPPAGSRRAVIFGAHWLEIGGAERWAVEMVLLATRLGLTPVVITDRESQHPWITRPEFDDALVIPLTHPTGERDETQNLLRALLENLDVRGVSIHHCHWMYDRLPWLKASRPDMPVVDSLHIIEYNGGGYPAVGVHFDRYVDVHHVISPQLERWLVDVQQIDPAKIAMAPLVGLTTDHAADDLSPRRRDDALTISFVGRFVRQKRPYLFLKLLRDLHRAHGGRVVAIMQGGGDMEDVIAHRIRKYGLEGVVKLRAHDFDVGQTLTESDVLVISSQNEGLTLTTFEAIASGIPVISTDVGSQKTLISDPCLLPRAPRGFLRLGVEVVLGFTHDDAARRAAWTDQLERAKQFSEATTAADWAREVFRSWSR